MCNANNHRPGCNCGWGGGYHSGGYYSGVYRNPLVMSSDATSENFFVSSRSFENDFCRPTSCPECGQQVYFVRHNGGSVWFDELGPPWPKHKCMDRDAASVGVALNSVTTTQSSEFMLGLATRVSTKSAYSLKINIICEDESEVVVTTYHTKKVKEIAGELVLISLSRRQVVWSNVTTFDILAFERINKSK